MQRLLEGGANKKRVALITKFDISAFKYLEVQTLKHQKDN